MLTTESGFMESFSSILLLKVIPEWEEGIVSNRGCLRLQDKIRAMHKREANAPVGSSINTLRFPMAANFLISKVLKKPGIYHFFAICLIVACRSLLSCLVVALSIQARRSHYCPALTIQPGRIAFVAVRHSSIFRDYTHSPKQHPCPIRSCQDRNRPSG